MAVLVILTIIYVTCCNYLLSPSTGGNNMQLCIDLHLYSSNCILFWIFRGRAKFNKSDFNLALYMFICWCKFEIIQYMLKYKCICICLLSYYTYSGTEYLDSSFVNITWVLQYLFSCFFPSVPPLEGAFEHPHGLIPKLSSQ